MLRILSTDPFKVRASLLDFDMTLSTALKNDNLYDLKPFVFPDNDNRIIIDALKAIGRNKADPKLLTYYFGQLPEAYLQELEQGNEIDKNIALDYRKKRYSFSRRNSVRHISFVDEAHVNERAVSSGVDVAIARKIIAAHEMAHKFFADESFANDREDLLCDYIASKLVSARDALLIRLCDGNYTSIETEIRAAVTAVLKDINPEMDADQLYGKLDYAIRENEGRLEAGDFDFGAPVINKKGNKTYLQIFREIMEPVIAEKLKGREKAPRDSDDLLDRIAKRYVENLESTALSKKS